MIEVVQHLLVMLFLATVIALIVGLIAPVVFSRLFKTWATRKRIAIIFSTTAIVLLFLIGTTAPDERSNQRPATSSAAKKISLPERLNEKKSVSVNHSNVIKQATILGANPNNIILKLEKRGFKLSGPRLLGELNNYGAIHWSLKRELKQQECTVELYGHSKSSLYAVAAFCLNYTQKNGIPFKSQGNEPLSPYRRSLSAPAFQLSEPMKAFHIFYSLDPKYIDTC